MSHTERYRVDFNGVKTHEDGMNIQMDGLNQHNLELLDDTRMMLCPDNDITSEQPNAMTLQKALQNVRSNPHITYMSVPVVKTLDETIILWEVWKNSVLDSMVTIANEELNSLLNQSSSTILKKQLETTIQSWRDSLNSLQTQREELQGAISRKETELHSSMYDLQKSQRQLMSIDTSAPKIIKILMNAADVLDSTYEEKRQLQIQQSKLDGDKNIENIMAFRDATRYFISSFRKDISHFQEQTNEALRTIERTIKQKRQSWTSICQHLQENFDKGVRVPLKTLMDEILSQENETMPLDLVYAKKTLNNENDSYCIRRCEVALMEISSMQRYFMKKSRREEINIKDMTSMWDDVDLMASKKERVAELNTLNEEHEHRIRVYYEKFNSYNESLARSKGHLSELIHETQRLKDEISNNWESLPSNAESAKAQYMATITRIEKQKQQNLALQIDITQKEIDKIETIIRDLKLSDHDRLIQLDRALMVTNSAINTCYKMKSLFDMAIQTEEMMRHVVQNQFKESCDILYNDVSNMIYSAADYTRSQQKIINVNVRSINDRLLEVNRRIDVLNASRSEQSRKMTGPDIALFTSLEEHVSLSNELHHLKDTMAKIDSYISICEQCIACMEREIVRMS